MNHMPMGRLTVVAQANRPGKRALAKQRSRKKIVTAAKSLFAQRGYDGATIRDIAASAGLSTGAVFASFADKADLFADIAGAEHDALYEVMRAAAGDLPAPAAVQAMFEAAADRHMADFALFRTTMSAVWSPDLGGQLVARLHRRPVVGLLAASLKTASARPDAVDATLVAEMLWDAYLATMRRAALDNFPLADVRARLKAQIGTILAGAGWS